MSPSPVLPEFRRPRRRQRSRLPARRAPLDGVSEANGAGNCLLCAVAFATGRCITSGTAVRVPVQDDLPQASVRQCDNLFNQSTEPSIVGQNVSRVVDSFPQVVL